MCRCLVFQNMLMRSWLLASLFLYGILLSQQASESIEELVQQLKKNPDDLAALYQLGDACYNSGRFDMAMKCYEHILKQNHNDAHAIYYTGQILEKQNQKSNALKIYRSYKKTKEGFFEGKIEERSILLKHELTLEEVKDLLQNEQAAGSRLISDAVAVLPFTVPEGQSAYGPLAKGLAEMVMTDLSQIKDLKTVERIRVQALVDEMNLGQTGLIEPSSAARFGKLLSAGRVVRGDLSMGTKNKIKLDAVTLDAIRNKTTSPVTVADVFERLFRIEKELVFKVLNQLDIDPTPQERQRIMMVPTRNLQAFMAYCSGLDLEDKGAFEQAVAQYQKALDLDPDFSLAKEKMKVSRILARFNVQVKKSGSIASRSEGREVFGFDREILLSNRLHTIRANIGSKFFLGKDVRKPYQEMSETEIPTGGENLPLPPAPPQPVP